MGSMRYVTPPFASLKAKLFDIAPGGVICIPPYGLRGSSEDWYFPLSHDGTVWVQVETNLFQLTDGGDFVFKYAYVPDYDETSVVVSENGRPYVYNEETHQVRVLQEDGNYSNVGSIPSSPWSPIDEILVWYIGPTNKEKNGLWALDTKTGAHTNVALLADHIVGVVNGRVYVFSESEWKLMGISITGNVVYESHCPGGISPAHIYVTPGDGHVLYVLEDLNGITILSDSEYRRQVRMPNLRASDFIGVHHRGLWFERDGMFGLLIV